MAKSHGTSIERHFAMNDLFASLSAKEKSAPKPMIAAASAKITPPQSFADSPKLEWLADHCIRGDDLVTLSRYRMSMVRVCDVMRKNAPDSEVFQHAIQKSMSLVTQDREFADYQTYDHKRVTMTLVLPEQRHSSIKLVVAKAIGHFLRQFAAHARTESGVTVCYDTVGNFQAFRPQLAKPNGREYIAAGTYING